MPRLVHDSDPKPVIMRDGEVCVMRGKEEPEYTSRRAMSLAGEVE